MGDLITKENWSVLKARLKDEHAILTEKDLEYEDGKEDKLLGTLEQKLGMTRPEVASMLRDYSQK